MENTWIQDAIERIQEKMDWVSDKHKNAIPYTTDKNGNYDDRSDSSDWGYMNGLDWWTNGFWGGLMWLLYQQTNQQKYADYANISETKLSKTLQTFYGLHHDVGFMFQTTAIANYRLTGNVNSRLLGLHAANLLAGRFNLQGGFIRAWNSEDDRKSQAPSVKPETQDWSPFGDDIRGWAIIDCMMNISTLYWASAETKDPRFFHIATKHAQTAAKYFVRDDGSVNHIIEIDPFTGEFVKTYAGQGYNKDSSWSRGQAWALYGFANTYKNTKDPEFLNTAKKIAHYCIANIRSDGLVPLDFRQPLQPELEDSAGACIIASGLLEIADVVPEYEKAIYKNSAIKILKAIYDLRSDWTKDNDSIVKNCSSAYHDTAGHHMRMVYADYFFVEAIYKLKDIGIYMW